MSKEPWEMTQAEYVKSRMAMADPAFLRKADKIAAASRSRIGSFSGEYASKFRLGHKNRVEAALRQGKTVPSKVLKEYPDLAKKARRKAPKRK